MDDATLFEPWRGYLNGLAYRILGSVSDAEDMVQETYVRWREAGAPDLTYPRAWLAKTCTRLCLDRLRATKRERELYPGEWLPEPRLEIESEPAIEVHETLSLALLCTIQKLSPSGRAAFLLHDVFGYSFREVGEILGLSPANCRQWAVRARRALREPGGPAPQPAKRTEVARLASAFFEAVQTGDDASLRDMLAADVVLRADGGGKATAIPRPLHGAEAVARFLLAVVGKRAAEVVPRLRTTTFNGAPGVVVYEGAEPVSAFQFEVEGATIRAISVVRNPDKLTAFATDS